MTDQKTIHDVTYDLLRTLGITTVFGNPGSTEQTFLQDFPADFTYVLALQEASAVAMADGFAQATGKPALVNLHTAAGTGNGMGSLVAAYRANTPLIVTAGQQTREMSIVDPYLNNPDATTMPKPWVKWAFEPARAEDVPAAFMRAYAVAMQPPMGPVFLSIPLDDWQKPALGPAVVRTISTSVTPDCERLRGFADRINRAKNPLLLLGPEVDRAGGWEAGIAFAEKLGAPVHASALTDRVSFPENHRLYAGPMPMTIDEVNRVIQGHDLVIAIGAQVFRYYPYVAGEYLPEGTDLLQITVDPHLASIAPVGDSLVGDVRIALEHLFEMVDAPKGRPAPTPLNRDRAVITSKPSEPLTADEVYHTLSTVKPDDAAVVMESTSTMAELLQWLPTTRTGSFFATGSGGIGWGVPGAVGVALGDRERGVNRKIVATIGDGSFQYSIQSIWTAAQHELPIVFVVLRNGAYAILKSFALLEKTPNVPALDLPGLDISALATGFGCRTANVETTDELASEFKAALEADGPTVIVVSTQAELPHLG
ncbi:benzoylformate decarboxylase [Mycolicibacterium sp. P9-64]|uniref:benzoylformate decarboxylase n=1 Tax=Mycolicibacterium sp. P9-64 TaxID=2024612 RepID=UPI0011EBD113|nr:benzoylformate decarboxylase [Mycolicibacterium sp. P9-64]KAA0077397.1 benzoylformate decarboxylase [Mycolicibacterium sp. P9-64]